MFEEVAGQALPGKKLMLVPMETLIVIGIRLPKDSSDWQEGLRIKMQLRRYWFNVRVVLARAMEHESHNVCAVERAALMHLGILRGICDSTD